LYNDYVGGVISSSQAALLEQKLVRLDKTSGIQFSVVIIPSLDGYAMEDWRYKIFNAWGIGHKNDAGLLLVLAINDRKSGLEVGSGLEGDLPDITCNDILRNVLKPQMKAGNTYDGINATIDAVQEKLGVMSWDNRMKMRTDKALADRIYNDRKKLDDSIASVRLAEAEKANAEAREQRSREFGDGVTNVFGSIVVIGFPLLLIYLLGMWIMRIFAEKKRRTELGNTISSMWTEIYEYFTAIQSSHESRIGSKQSQWIVDKSTQIFTDAEGLYAQSYSIKNQLSVYTRGKIDNQNKYNSMMTSYSDTIASMNTYQTAITIDLPAEIAAEEKAKKEALQHFSQEKENTNAFCTQLRGVGYDVDHEQAAIDLLEQAFHDIQTSEEKLGKDFDNQVEKLCEKLRDVYRGIEADLIAEKSVIARIPAVKNKIAAIVDKKSLCDTTKQSLKSKYHTCSTVDATITLYEMRIADIQRLSIVNIETILLKKLLYSFDHASDDVTAIENSIREANAVIDTLEGLDALLMAAKSDIATLLPTVQSTINKIHDSIYHRDVNQETRTKYNALCDGFSRASSLYSSSDIMDWVVVLGDIRGMKKKFDSLYNDAISQQNYAEAERQRIKRRREQEERDRLQAIQDAEDTRERARQRERDEENNRSNNDDNSSNNNDSFGGFGGGSSSGGGSNGDW
jgi:uncharacterized membrane protein YgcG